MYSLCSLFVIQCDSTALPWGFGCISLFTLRWIGEWMCSVAHIGDMVRAKGYFYCTGSPVKLLGGKMVCTVNQKGDWGG